MLESLRHRLIKTLRAKGLSVRTAKALANYVCSEQLREYRGPYNLQEQVEWITTMTNGELRCIPNIGPVRFAEVRRHLELA